MEAQLRALLSLLIRYCCDGPRGLWGPQLGRHDVERRQSLGQLYTSDCYCFSRRIKIITVLLFVANNVSIVIMVLENHKKNNVRFIIESEMSEQDSNELRSFNLVHKITNLL